jgi:hypothetical protein
VGCRGLRTLAAPTVATSPATRPALTATTSPPKPAIRPTPAAASGDTPACMVGTWVVTSTTITSSAGQQSGGAGAQWEISRVGALTETLSGSQPITSPGRGGVQVSGVLTATLQLPQDPNATSGAWVATNRDDAQQTSQAHQDAAELQAVS